MVGDREYLYTRLIAILRDAFIKTKDFNFCSLRMEIVMAVHDNKVSVDKIGKISLCFYFCFFKLKIILVNC